jgi:hypothetical protein
VNNERASCVNPCAGTSADYDLSSKQRGTHAHAHDHYKPGRRAGLRRLAARTKSVVANGIALFLETSYDDPISAAKAIIHSLTVSGKYEGISPE